jgi:hypothetical protein
MHFGKKPHTATHIHDLHSFFDVGSEYFQGLVKKFTHRIVKYIGQPPGTDVITSGGLLSGRHCWIFPLSRLKMKKQISILPIE